MVVKSEGQRRRLSEASPLGTPASPRRDRSGLPEEAPRPGRRIATSTSPAPLHTISSSGQGLVCSLMCEAIGDAQETTSGEGGKAMLTESSLREPAKIDVIRHRLVNRGDMPCELQSVVCGPSQTLLHASASSHPKIHQQRRAVMLAMMHAECGTFDNVMRTPYG